MPIRPLARDRAVHRLSLTASQTRTDRAHGKKRHGAHLQVPVLHGINWPSSTWVLRLDPWHFGGLRLL